MKAHSLKRLAFINGSGFLEPICDAIDYPPARGGDATRLQGDWFQSANLLFSKPFLGFGLQLMICLLSNCQCRLRKNYVETINEPVLLTFTSVRFLLHVFT